ncbi:hypothetical protein KAI54_00700 [Candidatus Gracilibacteria bacterium]|nr:hypothetical protein [Candidatus Gracilibacteria bacterium]
MAGTGVSVSAILCALSSGKTEKQIISQARKMNIPLKSFHIRDALSYSAEKIKGHKKKEFGL